MGGYANNGTSRSLKVTVTKTLGGIVVQGYPKTYDGQQSWGNPTYPTLTDIEARRLSDSEFSTRYNAFVAYVQSVEPGSNFATDIVGAGPTKVDSSCLATTTTTTTAAPLDKQIQIFIIPKDLGDVDPGSQTSCGKVDIRHSGTSGIISGTIQYVDTATQGDGSWYMYYGDSCGGSFVGGSASFTLSPGEATFFSYAYAAVSSDSDTNVTKVIRITHNATNIATPKDTIITAHVNV